MGPERPRRSRPTVRDVHGRLEEVTRAAERDPAEWDALRSRLDSVETGGRGLPWRETSVLLDLTFRQRPVRARRQLRRIREQRLARGSASDFERFWTECRRALTPYALTPHGYGLALGSRDATTVWRRVADVTEAFGALGHPVLVHSGTLLGLVREGGLLADDDDVDLALVLGRDDSADAAGAAHEWRELRARAVAAGLADRAFEERHASHFRVPAAEGLQIDVMPAWQGGERMFVWPHTYGDVAAADVLPPVPHRVGGQRGPVVLLPRRPELLLEANYGPGWREPDPTYRFDWDRAHERFAGFIGHLGSRRGAGTGSSGEDG